MAAAVVTFTETIYGIDAVTAKVTAAATATVTAKVTAAAAPYVTKANSNTTTIILLSK